MQQERQRLQNGNRTETPRDELDVANQFVGSSNYEELLKFTNLGTGYYEDGDFELQMRSFVKGFVMEVSVANKIWELAKEETKVKLADEGFHHYNESKEDVVIFDPFEEVKDDYSSRTVGLQEYGEKIWKDLSEPEEPLSDKQAAAMAEKTSVQELKPLFWRILTVFHEGSKSKGARTQDNYFGRVKKRSVVGEEDDSGGLLRRRS